MHISIDLNGIQSTRIWIRKIIFSKAKQYSKGRSRTQILEKDVSMDQVKGIYVKLKVFLNWGVEMLISLPQL